MTTRQTRNRPVCASSPSDKRRGNKDTVSVIPWSTEENQDSEQTETATEKLTSRKVEVEVGRREEAKREEGRRLRLRSEIGQMEEGGRRREERGKKEEWYLGLEIASCVHEHAQQVDIDCVRGT